jgi:hypothetical protein
MCLSANCVCPTLQQTSAWPPCGVHQRQHVTTAPALPCDNTRAEALACCDLLSTAAAQVPGANLTAPLVGKGEPCPDLDEAPGMEDSPHVLSTTDKSSPSHDMSQMQTSHEDYERHNSGHAMSHGASAKSGASPAYWRGSTAVVGVLIIAFMLLL